MRCFEKGNRLRVNSREILPQTWESCSLLLMHALSSASRPQMAAGESGRIISSCLGGVCFSHRAVNVSLWQQAIVILLAVAMISWLLIRAGV
jgi:hypothetical protein